MILFYLFNSKYLWVGVSCGSICRLHLAASLTGGPCVASFHLNART